MPRLSTCSKPEAVSGRARRALGCHHALHCGAGTPRKTLLPTQQAAETCFAPAPSQWLARCAAVLPHHLVALNLIARVRSLVQPARLVARAHVQPAAPADEAVAEAAAVKVLHVPRLSHALQDYHGPVKESIQKPYFSDYNLKRAVAGAPQNPPCHRLSHALQQRSYIHVLC
jgi:hypothetical protein